MGTGIRTAIAVLFLGIACSDSTSPPPAVASVTLSPTPPVDLVPGATQMLVAVAKDASGATLTDRITTWSSSDAEKASVAAGLVTGVATGTATITATVEGRAASVEVRVHDGAVVGVAGNSFTVFDGAVSVAVPAGAVTGNTSLTVAPAVNPPASVRLISGSVFDLGPTATTFSQPVTLTLRYDPALVTGGNSESELQLYEVVAGSWSLVSGSSANTGTRTVSGSVSRLGTFAVMVPQRVETVTIGGDLSPLTVVTTRQLSATLRDIEGVALTRPIEWSSSNPSVLSIDAATGLATAKIPGTATITAAAEGKSTTASITVVPGPPEKLIAWAGNNQTARPGAAVATPPSVMVTDAHGNPLPGVAVTFAVTAGGGSIPAAVVDTNGEGIAAVGSWTLGTAPGPNTLTASASGLSGSPFVFNATAALPSATAMVAAGGNNQSGQPGSPLPVNPSVRLTDADGAPVAGVAVTFAVTAGGGSIAGAQAVSNAEGIASAGVWTLGPAQGTNTVVASSADLPGISVAFTASAGPPPPARILGSDGEGQSAPVNTFIPVPPSVLVHDANGNPVIGAAVTFSIGLGGGAVTGADALTDAFGVARVGTWRLGPTPGQQTLLATAPGLVGSPVIFNAYATVPAAAGMAVAAGNNQTARPGFAVATAPAVILTDADGAPVSGIVVTFSVTGGGGSITGSSATTGADGIAAVGSWTLGGSPGPNTLTVEAAGLSLTFNATAALPGASTMSINGGNNVSGVAGQQVGTAPSVKITDSEGNPVAGVTVTFAVLTGGGSITGATPTTNASGIATVGSWTLGIGGNSLSASSPGLNGNPLTFFATGAAEVQIVTFGDSNTDIGFSGTNPTPIVASYVSSANASLRLSPTAPHSGLQLAGKIESRWKANSSRTIKVANHGISTTQTGTGRIAVGAPNALEQVGGISRFRGEVMGDAYPWSGGEPTNEFYPGGPIQRVQAFVPRTSDFAYVSIGTNDIGAGVSPATIEANLRAMVGEWVGRGLPAGRFMITTIPPRAPGASGSIPDLNTRIRAIAASTGVRLIDLSGFVSGDDGLTWKPGMQLDGDPLHYSEAVRNWLADQVVSIMLSF